MENKKQLLIIPPMSEPLQKLKEVLDGIATDENIEISIIDDLKELMQFVGSSGQCLIAFSNAKKCATFLQENRFLIAKTHSKVILLTPKEIPAKTLIKFTKIGLTESILENSPPKTLLYKVKLLLRSIKSSGSSEEKELAVKSIDAGAAKEAQAKGEINSDKLQGEEGSVNYLAEERAKFKKTDSENAESVNYMDNLKGKTTAQEETIDTHWKSKRKKDETLPVDAEEDVSKLENEDSAEIDMYYRGKKKSNAMDIIETDEIKTRKKLEQPPEEEDLIGKTANALDLDLAPAEAEKRKKLREEEEADYQLKTSRTTDELPVEEEEERSRPILNEEEEEERKRKELMELESLFEEAKKKQQAQEAEDLGGHYKGKISTNQLDLEEPELTEEREDYDNSDLYSKEKPLDLDLAPAEEEKRRRLEEDEDEEEKERDGFGEKLGGNLESEEGQTDHIETMMKSDMGSDRSKKIQTHDIQERKRTKEELPEEETESRELDLKDAPAAEEKSRKKQNQEEVAEEEESNSIDLDLASADSTDAKKRPLEEEEVQPTERESQTRLKLVDGDRDSDREKNKKDESDHMSFRKLDNSDLDVEERKEKSGTGKTDKIDTFYRSGDARKKDQDWDLDEKRNNLDLGLEKKAKRGPDGTQKKEDNDLGEQTIDYRKMKEEFEAIARGEDPEGVEGSQGGPGRRKNSDEEDASFKVVEPDAAGFDFAIEILNMIYQKELKAEEFFKVISEELQKTYHAYPVFYGYKPSDKKHNEVYDSILKISTNDNLKMWWMEHKKNEDIFSDIQTKTMSTWVCREMNWEDVELPAWASNELTSKKVELIYPFFDGVDRMGLAVLYFPEGINPKQVRGLEVTVEMARTLMLETLQRKSVQTPSREEEQTDEETQSEKKNILSVFSGLFKGKKAG